MLSVWTGSPKPRADLTMSKLEASPANLCTQVVLRLDCLALQLACGVSWGRGPEGALFLTQVAYPDCSPIMILSEASLADLNTRLVKKVKMDQFRPNIVVTGCDAFEEVGGSLFVCYAQTCCSRH